MAGAKFDILFAGELMPGADPDAARRQLQQRFNLSDDAVEKLFSGRPLTIKRYVDTTTASRYREIFREAKALVRIQPVETRSEGPMAPPESSATETPDAEQEERLTESDPQGLHLASNAKQNTPLEQPSIVDHPDIDISRLRLVSGQNWTLEDCRPPQVPVDVPQTSHLDLVKAAPESREEHED